MFSSDCGLQSRKSPDEEDEGLFPIVKALKIPYQYTSYGKHSFAPLYGRLIRTPAKYIFSESLGIIEDVSILVKQYCFLN